MKRLALTLVSIGFCLVSSPAFGLDAANIWYAASLNTKSRVVLLIHGYYHRSAVDCRSYFSGMKEAIAQKRYEVTGKKNIVKTVGWYAGDKNCDVSIGVKNNYNIGTSIPVISKELANFIETNYTANSVTVDIVAHSLGGLIVRKMLDLWGDDLWVEDVVTLGTPHAGVAVGAGLTALGCNNPKDKQCEEASAVSDFIRDLSHNPQSVIRTAWTIIGTKRDEIVGTDTSVSMNQDDESRPKVVKYQYPRNYRDDDNCVAVTFKWIGHDTLVHNRPVVDCTSGIPITKANPTALTLEGINRVH